MPKFINPNAPEGRFVLNGHYVFQDGVLPCSKDDAERMKKILVEFNGCELVEDEEVEAETAELADSSLNAEVTKTAAAEAKPVEAKVKAKS